MTRDDGGDAATGEGVPAQRPGPSGIGGWLILPLIGLALTLFRGSPFLASSYGETIRQLPLLLPAQKAFVLIELTVNAVIILVLPIALFVLLFLKRRAFVRWYVVWALLSLGIVLFDVIFVSFVFPERFPTFASVFERQTNLALARALVLAACWIPYMLLSRRVANTFVN